MLVRSHPHRGRVHRDPCEVVTDAAIRGLGDEVLLAVNPRWHRDRLGAVPAGVPKPPRHRHKTG